MAKGYYTFTRITDYGPYVTKLILPMDGEAASSVTAETFSVYVERMDDLGRVLSLPKSWMAADDKEPSQGYIPVLAAYPSDLMGEKSEAPRAVTLEMAYGPLFPLSASISAPEGLNVCVKSRYFITQKQPIHGKGGVVSGLSYDFCLGGISPDDAGWLHGTADSEEEPLNYGYFIPQNVQPGPRPLLIWLHGAGEGGTDPTVAYIGNKVVALSSGKIQSYFGGAYVLAPQTRTFWMNDGTGRYGPTGKSIYVKALKACIDAFIARNPGIDKNRVYIGGDSNGGFMTMRMVIDYPDFFAAAFPVCEALYDNTITDEQIKSISHLPIWFTHAKDDPVVKPEETVVPTYQRLIKAGAENVHFTFWDNITDIHEGFVDKDGKPFRYIGHFAWIPLLNDDCRLDYDGRPVTADGKEVSLLQWLALQKKA